MDGWMDGWMSAWVDEWMDGCMNGWMGGGSVSEWMERDVSVDGWTESSKRSDNSQHGTNLRLGGRDHKCYNMM